MHWWNCCREHEGCPIHEDDFNREDTTDLGSGWEEVAGDSDIYDQTLRVPAGGMVIGTKPHPHDWTGVLGVDMVNLQEGNVYRLIINYDDDNGDDYLYAQFAAEANGFATFGIYSSTSGVLDAARVNYTPGTTHGMSICRSLTGIYAMVSSLATLILFSCEGERSGRKAGVGNPGPNTVQFDNYRFWENWFTDPVCPKCPCECSEGGEKYYCMHKLLYVSFVDVSERCDCLQGAWVEIGVDEWYTPHFTWLGSKVLPWWQCFPGMDYLYEFKLICTIAECDPPPGEWSWLLLLRTAYSGSLCGDWGGPTGWPYWGQACPIEKSCNPFYARYGPFHCTDQYGTCTYYIEVTE